MQRQTSNKKILNVSNEGKLKACTNPTNEIPKYRYQDLRRRSLTCNLRKSELVIGGEGIQLWVVSHLNIGRLNKAAIFVCRAVKISFAIFGSIVLALRFV